MTQDKENTFCCPLCGSTDVEVRAWVNANTHTYSDDAGYDLGYCPECGEFVEACTVAEFERNNPTSNCD